MELIDLWRGFTLTAPAVVFGLLVVWASVSTVHWFFRVAAVVAACSLPLATVAHQVAIFGLASGGVVVIAANGVRRLWACRRSGAAPTFRLVDLLLATAIVAAATGMVCYSLGKLSRVDWQPLLATAMAYSLSLAAVIPVRWIAGRWWPLSLLSLLTSPLYAVAIARIDWLGIEYFWDVDDAALIVAAILQVALLWLLLAAYSFTSIEPEGDAWHRWPLRVFALRQRLMRWTARGVITLVVVSVVAVSAWFCVLMAKPIPEHPPLPPGPNSYAELLALARPLGNVAVPGDLVEATDEEYAAFFLVHGERLDEIQRVLNQPSRVVPPADVFAAANASISNIDSIRATARSFHARSEMYQSRGELDKAAESAMQCVWLGKRTADGGIYVDVLVGMAVAGFGEYRLRHIRSKLDAETCKAVCQQLEEIDAAREPIDDIHLRDRIWSIRYGGWQWRVQEVLDEMEGKDSERPTPLEFPSKRQAVQLRLLYTEFAILAFQQERGRPPRALDELVPDYLRRMPLDPLGDGPLRYRTTREGYLLYSVGFNGQDDGGELVNWNAAVFGKRGDFFLDTPDLEDES